MNRTRTFQPQPVIAIQLPGRVEAIITKIIDIGGTWSCQKRTTRYFLVAGQWWAGWEFMRPITDLSVIDQLNGAL